MPANKTPSTPSAPRVIDLTPTWEGLLPALLAVITNGGNSRDSSISRATAIESLRQVCASVDASNKRCAAVNSRSAAAANAHNAARVIDMDPANTYTVRIETKDRAALNDLLGCEVGCTISAYEFEAPR